MELRGVLTPEALADWQVTQPVVLTLMVMMVLDVAMGLVCAIGLKTVSSTASFRGMSKKAAMLLIVAVAVALDPFMPNVVLGKLVALFYCTTEGLSILENAGRAGVPLPSWLKDSLAKLKPAAPKEAAKENA